MSLIIGLPALAAALASACAFSAFDALRKRAADGLGALPLLFCLTLLQWPFYIAWALVVQDFTLSRAYLLPGALSLAVGFSANFLFLAAISRSPLSKTIPVLSLTPGGTALFGWLILGEDLALLQWLGIGLSVGGIVFLNLPKRDGNGDPPGPLQALRGFLAEPGMPLMAVVALIWSISGPIDKVALQAASPSTHAVIQMGIIAVGLAVVLALRGELGQLRQIRKPLTVLAAGAMGAAAWGSQLLAFSLAPVALVETIKRVIGNLSALIAGRLFFGEPFDAAKIAGIVLMCAGVPMVLLA